MHMKLDPFYPVLDSTQWLRQLLPLGLRLVQLRVKELQGEALAAEIRLAKRLCKKAQCELIINDYWQLAIELGCDYIHLGQEDLDAADMRAIRSAGLRFGISTHSEAELHRAISLKPDYIALGPVYPTILKKMPWQAQGLARVSQWKKQLGALPLVGIGGLNLDRAAGVLDAGADSVALVTDITLNPDPLAQTRRWLSLTEKYR
jgi:thiamine-phosphate pyrophosphorylase